MAKLVLALDQGTTSSRSVLFGHDGVAVAIAQQEFPQILPSPGHVEHDCEDIWNSQLATARQVIQEAEVHPEDIVAIGITNQRETTVLWDRATGEPVANAIVWQSRVSADICEAVQAAGKLDVIREKTGLLLDAYFSASKIKYLLDQDPDLRRRAEDGEILFGTVDSFLIWRLTGGKQHVTDYSNASRTLLFNIHTLEWDDELLEIFGVPRAMLPTVVESSQLIGTTEPELFGAEIPIAGIAGDQQAATFGQACFDLGDVKNTYGTGSFILMNTGESPVKSENKLLTTIGWGVNGKITYCLEGSVFISGAVVQWLRDGLGLIEDSSEVEALAGQVEDSGGVEIVPAFVGLGAPYWDSAARGTIVGITRGTTAAHFARAALDCMALQTMDVVRAMSADAATPIGVLKVDGGASVNDSLMQFQADMLDVTVKRPAVAETTALGAAYLAGLAVGFWNDLQDVRDNWALQKEFRGSMDSEQRESRYGRWQRAVQRSLEWDQ
jgi:glycerol kinase|tara:strand:- start:1014 stop:2504 length:1491 start_codon:yes stop_codon:yes gene_type:complete